MWACTLKWIVWFWFIERIFETTHPYIYDSKEFSTSTDNKQTSVLDMKTQGNVELKCIAKSADYKKGNKLCGKITITVHYDPQAFSLKHNSPDWID